MIIGYEATAAARWALLLIVRTLFNDAFAIAVWTGFHVRLFVALLSHFCKVGLAIMAVSSSDIEDEIEAGVEVVAGIRYPHQQLALK